MAEKPELAKGSWAEERVSAPPAHWFFLVARPPPRPCFSVCLFPCFPSASQFNVFSVYYLARSSSSFVAFPFLF